MHKETTGLNRKTMLITTISLALVVSLSLAVYWYVWVQDVAKPSWVRSGTYVIYEQVFVWNGHTRIEYMTWNITRLQDAFADLHLVSHGVNVTQEHVESTFGEANFTINVFNREIANCSDPYYIGEKWPFWIETNVTIGSTIDIFYGTNVITKSQPIYVLGHQRDCWLVEYNWTLSSMKRWYDKSSGICLKIHVALNQQGIIVQITETAVASNIDLRVYEPGAFDGLKPA